MLIVSSNDTLVERIIKWHHCIIFRDFLFSSFLGNSLLPFTGYQNSFKGFNNCVKYFAINLENCAMMQLLALNVKFKRHYKKLKQNIPLCKVVSPLRKSWYTVQNTKELTETIRKQKIPKDYTMVSFHFSPRYLEDTISIIIRGIYNKKEIVTAIPWIVIFKYKKRALSIQQ